MCKTTFTRLLTLMLAMLVLLTACGTSEKTEDTTPEGEYAGLYQPTYLDWPQEITEIQSAAVYGNNAYAIAIRENVHSLERIEMPSCEKTTLVSMRYEETVDNITTYCSIRTLCPVPGGIWYVSFTGIQNTDDPNLTETTCTYEVVHVDDRGIEQSRFDISEQVGNSNTVSMAVDHDGNIAIATMDNKYHAFNSKGQHLFSDEIAASNFDFIRSANGGVYLRERFGEVPCVLYPVNFAAKKLGDRFNIPDLTIPTAVSGYGSDDFFVTDQIGLYAMSNKGELRKILDFLRHDIGVRELYLISADENGDYYGLETSRATAELPYSPIYFQSLDNMDLENMKELPSILQEKVELTYASISLTDHIRTQIKSFNRKNPQYRITLVDYYEKANYDFQDALNLFQMDITAGNIPDIFDISTLQFPVEKWETLVLDLYPFIDADPDYHRDAFIPGILPTLEYKDRLYRIGYQFSAETLVGKERIFGSEKGWSFEDFLKIQETLSNDTLIIGDVHRDELFYYFFHGELERFISEDGSQCYFDSVDFISLLEGCAALPQNPRYHIDEGTTVEQLNELLALMDDELRADKILLTPTVIRSPRVVRQFSESFDEKINFIGYPGSYYGTYLRMYNSFSISSACENPDVAWAFIRTILHPPASYSNIPILAAELDALLATEMTPLRERSAHVAALGGRSIGGSSVGEDLSPNMLLEDTPEYDNYPLTQEEVDQFMDIITSITTCLYDNTDVRNIVEDAVTPFFAGGKSAEETAKEIQSRVSILLAERN